jgi:hypothetical protein
MLRNPVNLACPGCGADLSAHFNELVRQKFGNIAPIPQSGLPPAIEIALRPASAKPAIFASHAPAAGLAEPNIVDTKFCRKHPEQRVTEKCRVCEKPICHLCVELFGCVCSVHCREKVRTNQIKFPAYAGHRDASKRSEWNKFAVIAKLVTLSIVTALGMWGWYEWFGSRPKPAFAIRFENEPAASGKSAFCPDNQIIFIHGDKLARYDLKSKKEVWLNHIVDKKKMGEEAAIIVKRMQEDSAKNEYTIPVPSVEKYTKDSIHSAERNLELLVLDKNIWVANGKKVVRYDWDSGQSKQEIEFSGGFDRAKRVGDELETREQTYDGPIFITRFNLVSGQVKTNCIGQRPPVIASTNAPASKNKNTKAIAAKSGAKPVMDSGGRKQLDPQKIAEAIANAPTAARIASPATLSVALNQQRALNLMDEMDGVKLPPGVDPKDAYKYRGHSEIIATRSGIIKFTVRMLEEKIMERNAMKAPPKKSALNGNVSVTATADIANELLNEMQRNAGGGIEREDHSRYLVSIHSGNSTGPPDWEGEVVGSPSIYPQPSVTIITAGKSFVVLDKSNKKKWDSTLNYPIAERYGSIADSESDERSGLGPVVERGDTLFVFDKGVLSAFELATGNARWRLPSVGIKSMFFDNAGSIYVNTTTASPEAIKFSKQIDVSNRIGDVVLKLDAKTGKQIWVNSMDGVIAYLEGKFIYTVSYLSPTDEDEELNPDLVAIGAQTLPYVRIRRIDPKNGHVMWDHFQQRGALDVKIHENTFQIVFKKEVQVLKFISF